MVINDEIIRIRDSIIKNVPVEKLYLFGSYANGTPHEDSDYDFYIIVPNDSIRPIDAIGEAHLAMRGMKVRSVDILAGTVDIFERRSRQMTIERQIEKKGIVLYERGK